MNYMWIRLKPSDPAIIANVSVINGDFWLFQPAAGKCGNWVKLKQEQIIGKV
jgi:hypothetical protein